LIAGKAANGSRATQHHVSGIFIGTWSQQTDVGNISIKKRASRSDALGFESIGRL